MPTLRSPPRLHQAINQKVMNTHPVVLVFHIESLHDRLPRSTKRSSDGNLGPSATTPRSTKRRKLLHPLPTALPSSFRPPNLVAYTRETISAVGNRPHVLGLDVQWTQLQSWY